MPPIALTKTARCRKKCGACIQSADAAFAHIPLTPERATEIAALAQHHLQQQQQPHILQAKAVNLSEGLGACLLASGLRSRIRWTATYAQQGAADDPVAILQACQLQPECNLVIIELQEGSAALSYAERCIAAFAMLSCVPVVFVAAEGCGALQEAGSSAAGSVWGTCSSYMELEQRLQGDLCQAVALREALLLEIQTLLQPYKEVKKLQHFAKRGAVALVPFAVHAVNAVGLVRLARQVLKVTGMGSSKQARKAVAGQAGAAGVKVTAIDSLSDVYQLIVQGTIVSEALTAAAGAASVAAGAAAAADTVSVLDAFTLGTVCVFTGMVSAWGAAVCRPSTVDGMARVIAAQQLVAAIKPSAQQVVRCSSSGSSDDDSQQHGRRGLAQVFNTSQEL